MPNLILRELELAPDTLIKWDLLRATSEGTGYRFAIPLLKHWLARNKPLKRVKMEAFIKSFAEGLGKVASHGS